MSATGTEELPGACFRSRASICLKLKAWERSCDKLIDDKMLEVTPDCLLSCLENSPTMSLRSITSLACDLLRMKLVNRITAEEDNIVIEFRWDPKSLVSIVAQTTDLAVGRQVLVMALDRFCRGPSLRKILTMKQLPTCKIRENPYLCPGHPPYDNFVDSLMTFLGIGDMSGVRNLVVFERFLESAADGAGEDSFKNVEEGGIRVVFHGTNHAVMEAILYSGLDPTLRVLNPTIGRTLDADYFGLDYDTSLDYSYVRTRPRPTISKLLVFMVINSEVTSWKPHVEGKATVVSNKFELPIAEITTN